MENANLVIKKYIPSLALFIIGFMVGYKYMEQSIAMGVFGGWILGGIVWGWYLTGNWFGPSHFETLSVFWIFGFIFRFMVSAAVGIIAMPLGIIQLIIALFVKGKEVSDAVNAYKAEHTDQNQPTVNTVNTVNDGSNVENTNQNSANTLDKPSIGFAILGFLVPLVGLILYLVWKRDMPLKAKSCGKGALIGFILSFVVPTIFMFIYPAMM